MPNDTKQSNVSSQPSTDSGLPPVVMEDVAPPMMNDGPQTPVVTTTQTTTTTVQDTPTDSGSAAPSDDIVMPPVITTQKKKFAGGKVIATILGLFLLVGGLGAGIMLVGQQQDIRERAGSCANNPCGPGLECDGSGGCRPDGSGDDYTGPVIEPPDDPWQDPDGDGAYNPSDNGGCSSGDYHCGGSGAAYDFCIQASAGKTCNEAAEDLGYVVPIGNVTCIKDPNGSWSPDTSATTYTVDGYTQALNQCTSQCPVSSSTCTFGSGAYICPVGHVGACTETNGQPFSGTQNSCFCGVVQFDTGSGHTSFSSTCGCGGNDTPPDDNPTPTSPAITAVCQNVKAYTTSWVLLTSAQLSQVDPGDSGYFCVTGVATGESFDKARFTINGVLQPETTTVRPGSTDFCQLYTIPTGVTTFNVTAQINHVTLGWK